MLHQHTFMRTSFLAALVLALSSTPVLSQEWKEVPGPAGLSNAIDLSSSGQGRLIIAKSYSFQTFWSWDEGKTWTTRQYPSLFEGGLESHYHVDVVALEPGVAMVSDLYVRDHMEQGQEDLGSLAVTFDSGYTWSKLVSYREAGPFSHTQEGADRKKFFAFSGASGGGMSFNYYKPGGYFVTTNGHDIQKVSFDSALQSDGPSVVESTPHIFVSSQYSHYESEDGGKTFILLPNLRDDSDTLLNIVSVIRLESGTLLAGGRIGAYRSTDQGHHWVKVSEGAYPEFSEGFGTIYHLASEHLPYGSARYDSLLYYSADDGLTWQSWKFDGIVASVVPVSSSLTYVLAGNKIYKRELAASVNTTGESTEVCLSPNPASDWLELKLPSDHANAKIRILDIAGREVLRFAASNRIDVSSLPNGVYQLLLDYDAVLSRKRFVIAR
jgi:hypothetical protein